MWIREIKGVRGLWSEGSMEWFEHQMFQMLKHLIITLEDEKDEGVDNGDNA